MARSRRDHQPKPLTLGQAVKARVHLVVWCKTCRHRAAEPDIAKLAERYGEATTVIEWAVRLRCSECGARDADFVVTSDHRPDYS